MDEKKQEIDDAVPTELDELNWEFRKERRSRRRTKKKHRFWPLFLLGALMLVTVLAIFIFIKLQNRDEGLTEAEIRQSPDLIMNLAPKSILTKEEQELWATSAADDGEVITTLSHRLIVTDHQAYIRLQNPIYSAYTVSVRLLTGEGENEKTLYASERLSPGTILEQIPLPPDFTLEEDELAASVEYSIYKGEDVIGYHSTDVKLVKR